MMKLASSSIATAEISKNYSNNGIHFDDLLSQSLLDIEAPEEVCTRFQKA
jgi:hypothetical protein